MVKVGQYFTINSVLQDKIYSLCLNNGPCLEPSAGEGHLVKKLESKYFPIVALEIDDTLSKICSNYINVIDFFSYSIDNKFTTVFGNPPFLKFREIPINIKNNLPSSSLLNCCNLFYYFIEKSFYHLESHGEIVFIIPREFLNSTRATKLRELLYKHGTITNLIDFKEEKLFKNAAPNVIIIRYEKDNLTHITKYETNDIVKSKKERLNNGSYCFSEAQGKRLSGFFDIKVGLVTGLNKVFERKSKFSIPMICSDYRITKKKRYFIFCDEYTLDQIYNTDKYLYIYLLNNKELLLKRKIKKFNESNWYCYGAVRNLKYMRSIGKCIYVNAKTRVQKPFFIDNCSYYDGSMLALYPKHEDIDLAYWCDKLNNSTTEMEKQGLYVNNKFMFTVKTLSDFIVNEK